jgi:hypothetical protein
MKLIVFISVIIFLFSNCTSDKCKKGESYVQFKKIFNNEQGQDYKGGEKYFKKRLLPKICQSVSSYKRVLLVEEISMFSRVRDGLIYVFDNDKLLYFSGNSDGEVKLGDGDNNLTVLRKVVDRLKPDCKNEIKKMNEVFSKMILHDAPLLQIILMDIKEGNMISEFLYSPDYILRKNW